MNKRTVSVIVPFYNEEKYIEECIRSLTVQTVPVSEIIAVDDGSKDNSKLKTKNLKQQFKIQNLFILEQGHRGAGAARNLGALSAKGEILVFADADMKFDERYIEKIILPIVKGEASATFTKEEYVANPENVWSKCWSVNSYLPVNMHVDPNIAEETTTFRAIKKEVFLQTKGFKDTGYSDDTTLLPQLKKVRAKAARGAICYHFNPGSLPEVFYSARWMGRGIRTLTLRSLLVFSLPNSVRRGIFEAVKYNMLVFIVFKIVFDLGYLIGMAQRSIIGIKYK